MEIYDGQYCVYCHTNKANGKKYIGITRRGIGKRWNYGFGYRKNEHFWNAIKKYGREDGFDHEIIASNLTKVEAYNFERMLIDKLQTYKMEYGYNQDLGGSGDNEHSEITKKKISKAKSGRCLGKDNHNHKEVVLGNHLFDTVSECAEYLEIEPSLISRWLNQRQLPPKILVDEGFGFLGEERISSCAKRQTRHKEILCDGKEFSSPKECAEYYNINRQQIYNWLSGVPIPDYFKEKGLRYKPTSIDLLEEKIIKLRKEVEDV